MKQKTISRSLAIVSTVCAAMVPYLAGRLVGVYTLLQSKPLISSLFTSTSHNTDVDQVPVLSSIFSNFNALVKEHGPYLASEVHPTTHIGSTIRYAETNESNQTAALSGTCQSLGLDIDKIDEQLLRSTISMEKMLSTIITNETFRESQIILAPRCEPLQVPLGSAMNHQRLHCDALLSHAYPHIYTWPLSGTASIDIFSCNAKVTLMSLIPTIRDLVVMNKASSLTIHEEPMIRWHYKFRGDRSDDGHSTYMNGDMGHYLCSYIDFDLKEAVISIETEYQTIDIYDTIDPRFKTREQYYASLRKDDSSYYSAHPELFRPDRTIYLDGILQSRYYGDAAYHEPLVHPALFTHPNPKRVAIVGGGEGATLREVLKHNTIQTVTMIEIDELMVNVSKQYIPEWSDCSMIVGSTPSCFDDPRAELFYTDGMAWFIDRYLNADEINDELLYDIIIMDALDPESSTEFSTVLYNTDDFMKALSNALRSDGIIVTQLGENFQFDRPGLHYSVKKIEFDFMENLVALGFDRMEDYTEAHGGFSDIWKYKILFKCRKCSYSRWHATQANVELEMKKRSMRCVNGCDLFRFFDGATMMGYQYVSRVNEVIHCRDFPQKLPDQKELWCENRHGYDPELNHIQARFEMLDADTVAMMPSLLTNLSYIGLDVLIHTIVVPPITSILIQYMSDVSLSDITIMYRWELWKTLLEKHCTPCTYTGSSLCFASLSLLQMATNQYTNATIDWTSTHNASAFEAVIYNPYISRNHLNLQWMTEMTLMAMSAAKQDNDMIPGEYTIPVLG